LFIFYLERILFKIKYGQAFVQWKIKWLWHRQVNDIKYVFFQEINSPNDVNDIKSPGGIFHFAFRHKLYPVILPNFSAAFIKGVHVSPSWNIHLRLSNFTFFLLFYYLSCFLSLSPLLAYISFTRFSTLRLWPRDFPHLILYSYCR
jgi:hypothetical protein